MLLNELQRDLLKELVNVYVGHAASLLSEMVNQKIDLNIPEVELIEANKMETNIFQYSSVEEYKHVVSSSVKFGHNFNGKAFLVFPAERAKMIVSACMGESADEALLDGRIPLDDTDFDVLKEISNLILNAIIGEFGNLLSIKLEYTLPEIEVVYISDEEEKKMEMGNMYFLLLHTDFFLSQTKVNGVVVVALGMDSVNFLVEKIDELLGELDG